MGEIQMYSPPGRTIPRGWLNAALVAMLMTVSVFFAVQARGATLQGSFELVGVHPEAVLQPTHTGQTLTSLVTYNGKAYAGFGDITANTGPIALSPFDPATDTFGPTHPASMTEAIYQFREFGGTLYAPDNDPQGTIGGFTMLMANGATEDYGHQDVGPVTHAYDMASFGGSLWMCGSLGHDAVIWRSTDGGVNWSQDHVSPGGFGHRFYGMGAYGGKLYTQLTPHDPVYPHQPLDTDYSLVFDGTSWAVGPDLTPDGGYIYSAQEFAGKLVYRAAGPSDHSRWVSDAYIPSPMYQFDGTDASPVPGSHYFDFVVHDGGLWALVAEYSGSVLLSIQVKRTANLVTWDTLIEGAPLTSASLTLVDDQLYIGARQAELYRFGPITDPSLLFRDGFESGDTSAWSATVP